MAEIGKGLAVLCAVYAMAGSPTLAQDGPARPAKVITVQSSDTVFRREYPAIVRPSQEAELSFRVSGRVTELPVRASQQIKEGEIIAALDPRDFETQIAQLESQRDQANAELRALRSGARAEEIAALEASVEAAQAQADQARDQAARSRQLTERGVAASAQLEQDEAALRVAEAQLRSALEQLAIGRSGGRAEEIEAAEAAIRGLETQIKTARDNLEDATLRAPFDGVIARRDIDNFTNIQAGQSIVLLQRLSVVRLVFDVPGPDVVAFASAEDVKTEAAFNALPDETFPAELVEFSTQADAATQTYRGEMAVTLPDDSQILPGMIGRVMASTNGNGGPMIEVPLTAVAANADGSSYVWVVGDGNTVARRAVTLGDVMGGSVQVSEGLTDGETVVTAGVTRLQEGMAIRPIEKVGG